MKVRVHVATATGLHVFGDGGERGHELAWRPVNALALASDGGLLAVANNRVIWRCARGDSGSWRQIATAEVDLAAIVDNRGIIYLGAAGPPDVYRLDGGGLTRLPGFQKTPGRAEWFDQGPPLHVRALTALSDGSALLAAVHVGGIPRSNDGGTSWAPTLAVLDDVHEVRAHPRDPRLVAAACGAGPCVSHDGGVSWTVMREGLDPFDSLSVAVLEDEALFSIQDGPFAQRAQIVRYRFGGPPRVERVTDGLPEWLAGKVDTHHLAAGGGRAALADGGGNLWIAGRGSRGWRHAASDVGHVFAVVVG